MYLDTVTISRLARMVPELCEKKKALPQSGHDFVFRFVGPDGEFFRKLNVT